MGPACLAGQEADINYYERHIGDYLKDTAHLSLLEHGVYTRLMDVYYTREGAIPAAEVARLIGARSKDERQALAAVLSEFFELDEDGYHQHRCDEEIERYRSTQPERDAKRENERERQRRARERRKVLFDLLREHGIVPAFDTPMAELQRMSAPFQTRDVTPPVTPQVTPPVTPVTRDVTATHTQSHTQYPIPNTQTLARAAASPPALRALGEPEEPEPPDAQPTPAGAICRAMGQAGLAGRNPGDPRFLTLIAQGATEAEFVGIAVEAVSKGKGWAWVLHVLAERRKEAAGITLAPTPTDPQAWRKGEAGIRRMQQQLGIDGPRPGEEFNAFERRVFNAWRRAGEPAPTVLEAA